jgi:hypothetical protein
MSVSSSEVTCFVRMSSPRLRIGQNATSSRLAGRLTDGAELNLNGSRVLLTVRPDTIGLKWNGGETSGGMWSLRISS